MASEPTEHDFEEGPDFTEPGSSETVADRLQERPEEIEPFLEAVKEGRVSEGFATEVVTDLSERSLVDVRTGLKNEVALLGSKGNRGELGKLARQCEREYILESDSLPPDEAGQAEGKRFAIVVVDLSDFKSINKRFGQEQGNRVLEAVGKAMTEGMRPQNEAYRLGGGADEFALLLPDVDSPELASRILAELETHMPEHPVTGEPVRFNRDKRGIEFYSPRLHRPDQAPELFAKALAAVRDEGAPDS